MDLYPFKYDSCYNRFATCEGADKSKVADFLRQLCMHAAAMKPQVISYKDLDKDFVEKNLSH